MCERLTKMACQRCGSSEWKSGHVSGGVFRCADCDRDVQRLKARAAQTRFDSAPGVLVRLAQQTLRLGPATQPPRTP